MGGLDDLIKNLPSIKSSGIVPEVKPRDNFTPTYFEFPKNVKPEQYLIGKIPKCKMILDLGCGLGYMTRYLQDNKCEIAVGIDPSADLIKQARSLQPIDHFYVDSFRNLSFKNGNFDAVWSQDSLKYAPDIGLLVSEIYRILKPQGGLYAIIPLYGLGSSEMTYSWLPSSEDEIGAIFKDRGFSIKEIETINVADKFGIVHPTSKNLFVFMICSK